MASRWTPEEDQALRDAIAAGKQLKDVPVKRSASAVKMRAFALGLRFLDGVEVRRQKARTMPGTPKAGVRIMAISTSGLSRASRNFSTAGAGLTSTFLNFLSSGSPKRSLIGSNETLIFVVMA